MLCCTADLHIVRSNRVGIMEVIHSATEIPAELNPIVNLFENTRCADCNAPEPDWTSLGFGTFVCLNCAGHHRAFGTHITYVRSVKLDTWSPSQTRCLEMGGNKAFADYASTFKHFSSYNKRIEKYTIPELLYYREILRAKIEDREPAEYKLEDWYELSNSVQQMVSACQSPTRLDRKAWTPDGKVQGCMICNRSFTVLFRRHHCRRCGKCVCSDCAPKENTRPIPEWGLTESVRHCKECYVSPTVAWK